MKSKRSKKKRPKTFPMRFVKGSKEEIINVPVEDHFSVIPMVDIGPPGIYPNVSHSQGLKSGEYALHPFKIRPDEHVDYLVKKYGPDQMSVDIQIDIIAFLRMIAKIAYCYTVWRYRLENIADKYVVPAILGHTNDIRHWVGGDGLQTIREESMNMNTDHIVMTGQSSDGELSARVKLFKKSATPEYQVIVGRLSDQAIGLYHSVGYK